MDSLAGSFDSRWTTEGFWFLKGSSGGRGPKTCRLDQLVAGSEETRCQLTRGMSEDLISWSQIPKKRVVNRQGEREREKTQTAASKSPRLVCVGMEWMRKDAVSAMRSSRCAKW